MPKPRKKTAAQKRREIRGKKVQRDAAKREARKRRKRSLKNIPVKK